MSYLSWPVQPIPVRILHKKPGMASTEAPRDASLQKRNLCLETLHEIFPDADLGDLRHRINSKFQEHIELSEQLKMLLEQSQMGRKLKNNVGNNETLQPWTRFRSREYIKAAETNLRREFKSLSRSTILAVMAENNNHYMKSRAILIDINRKSWRSKIASWLLLRPRPEEPRAIPRIVATGCKELDDELWELGHADRAKQASSDLAVAQDLNEKQYEEAGALLECECCFGDYAFEMMSACCHGHLFCHTCVVNAAKEGVYGQTTSLVKEKGSLRCLSSVADPPCDGYIPLDLVSRALPDDMLRAMEDKLTEDDLAHCGLPMAKCPFCKYAEADEIPTWAVRKGAAYATAVLAFILLSASPSIVFIAAAALLLALGYVYMFEVVAAHQPVYLEDVISGLTMRAVKEQFEKRREQMFQCRNSRAVCGKKSCRDCGKEWKAFHKCFENEEEALRLCVENAMAAAIKRTCPTCGTSFVKSDGCNKLTCVCGYVMCYVCRADLKGVGYKHFCQHFRQVPGTACSECDNCDLYVQEDESLVLKIAGERAQAEWLAKNTTVAGWKPPRRQVIAGYTLKTEGSGTVLSVEAVTYYLTSAKVVLEEALVQCLGVYVEFAAS
ncbi:E3 ubiquitin-protein ligase [Drechslerella dactyloides]|uniref:E3 ubiquitin-protein ligase n=1 Tax=Drechslerella dactyloides TaxID=74499 RepID=A0AAD6NHG3_DREDA|nr:E3 ubiquitin-protein ligase [Drechslerella dactyloides]